MDRPVKDALRILQLANSPADAEPVTHALAAEGVAVQLVQASTERDFKQALHDHSPHLFLCDYQSPTLSGRDAMAFVVEHYPDTPVIILTEALGDEAAVELIKAGARGYVLKDRLSSLPAVIRRALQEQNAIMEHKKSDRDLALFRTVLDQSDDSIEIADLTTMRFVDVNAGACRALGYTREELLSMAIPDVDPQYFANREKLQKTIESHGEARFETIHRRKDGTLFPVDIAVKIIQMDKVYALSISRDITERKQTERRLTLFRNLLDESDDSIEIVDMATMRFVDVNAGACRALGYTREELLSMGVPDIDPEFEANRERLLDPIQKHGEARFESVHRRKDGTRFPVDIAVKIIMMDKPYGLSIARDITERKQAEHRLTLFRALLDESDDAIEIIEPGTARFIDVNEGACRELRYSREELLSMKVSDIDPTYDQDPQRVIGALESVGHVRFETVHRRKDGSTLPVEVALKQIHLDKPYGLAITRDISERKESERLLRESKERYQGLVENTPAIIYSFNTRKGGTYYSPQAASTLGYSLEQLHADPFLWHRSIHPEDRERVDAVIKNVHGGERFEVEYRIRNEKGDWLWFLDRSIRRYEQAGETVIDGLAVDLTAHKQAEQERMRLLQNIRENASQLETIFATQKDVILLYNTDMVVTRSTPQFQRDYGFDPVGVHLSEIMQRVACRALNDNPVAFDDELHPPPTPGTQTLRPAPYKVNLADGSEAIVETWSAPFYVDGALQGVVTVWHDVTELKKASDDIAAYAKELEATVLGTLRAVASMVEQRDPYTAGHERRVGIIAGDIAREMGWSEKKCKELQMVGLVHDIGKIGIPSEILSKPSRLTDVEYGLIKTHVERGYAILQTIEFPFPVAEIVNQHHERMDGSGYPQGLAGEQILPEARIVAVADVLESMASHRPYRPALGIEKALDELMKNRSRLYDSDVVDATLALIREKGYQLPD